VHSDEYVYSHTDPKVNFKKLLFEFKTGDVLHFVYDQTQGKLTLTNQKGERYDMNVERIGEKYAVCAYLA
jgi:hypothetical protein